jgi:hypothetical protein
MSRFFLIGFLLLLPLSASAQGIIGSLSYSADSYFPTAKATTIIDYGTAASESGSFDRLVVLWSNDVVAASCPGGVRFKLVRPSDQSLGAYQVLSSAGPFFPGKGWNDFAMGDLQAAIGDVLAIEVSGPSLDCGSPLMSQTENLATIVFAPGALKAAGSLDGVEVKRVPYALAVRGSDGSIVRDAVLTVAGSAAGLNGSNFRTSMQIANPSRAAVSVAFAFVPAGKSGDDAPINRAYDIPPYETVTIADIGTEFGVTGLGSIDVYTIQGPLPLITSRIFNDLGEAGTLGFTQEPVRTRQMLVPFQTGHFTTPADPVRFRMNVGIRTLDEPARISVRSYNATFTEATNFVVKDYPSNYFEQVSLQTFVGATPYPGGTVEIMVEQGAVSIYASTTDNKTNDSSVVFVKTQ